MLNFCWRKKDFSCFYSGKTSATSQRIGTLGSSVSGNKSGLKRIIRINSRMLYVYRDTKWPVGFSLFVFFFFYVCVTTASVAVYRLETELGGVFRRKHPKSSRISTFRPPHRFHAAIMAHLWGQFSGHLRSVPVEGNTLTGNSCFSISGCCFILFLLRHFWLNPDFIARVEWRLQSESCYCLNTESPPPPRPPHSVRPHSNTLIHIVPTASVFQWLRHNSLAADLFTGSSAGMFTISPRRMKLLSLLKRFRCFSQQTGFLFICMPTVK